MCYAVFGAALRQKTGGLYLYGKDKLFCWTKQIKRVLFFGKVQNSSKCKMEKCKSFKIQEFKGLMFQSLRV